MDRGSSSWPSVSYSGSVVERPRDKPQGQPRGPQEEGPYTGLVGSRVKKAHPREAGGAALREPVSTLGPNKPCLCHNFLNPAQYLLSG